LTWCHVEGALVEVKVIASSVDVVLSVVKVMLPTPFPDPSVAQEIDSLPSSPLEPETIGVVTVRSFNMNPLMCRCVLSFPGAPAA
jgi:hypothetical protein